MQYEELEPISHDEAADTFRRDDDTYATCRSLLRLALHDDDWRWTLDQILRFVTHSASRCLATGGRTARKVGF